MRGLAVYKLAFLALASALRLPVHQPLRPALQEQKQIAITDQPSLGAWFSQFVTAFAVSGVLFAGSPVIAEEVRLDGASDGSPVATEVIGLVDKYFLDRSFNGVNLKKVSKDLEARGPLTDEEALELSTKLVKSLGDRYSRIISPA